MTDKALNIQMVDLKSQYQDIKKEIDTAISDVVENARFINGPIVNEFADALAEWNDTKYVITCANGTDGLQIAMMALDLKAGDKVIVPAFTYVATVEVIALLGLIPVFVDVEEDTFNIDAEQLKNVIDEDTKAIVPVHLYGQCANMDFINEIAQQYNLFVIEDLAQAIGAKYKGRQAGNLGNMGVTSFFPSKNLGCYGDGGAILTNDDELAVKIKMIANHGQKKKYYHDIIGVNSRLDSIQAAILNEKLKKLDSYIDNRRRAAEYYLAHLNNIEGITLPEMYEHSSHVFHQFTLRIADGKRDALADFLKNKGIPSMIYYPLPIPDQEAYKHYKKGSYPISDQLSKEVLSLPMHTHLDVDQLSYICAAIREFQ